MANIAILIGNTDYQTLPILECCSEDVTAMKELLEATGKFEGIEPVLNKNSSQLKECIRTLIDAHKSLGEIFFYFTGHGFQHDAEFFLCATNFDARRPNETGLSSSELHMLLRSPEADLVVKVIDSCCSGTPLVKSSDGSFLPVNKQGFKHLIQIASCLDSQNSLTGKPLSLFTDKFRAASLRKAEGVVYYTDIIDALRDDFLDNNEQTPHFVSQGTGREQFVENARKLDGLRAALSAPPLNTGDSPSVPGLVPTVLSELDILERADKRFASKELAQRFIAQLFEKLASEAASPGSFGRLFTSETVVHSDFKEPTAHEFLVRVLSSEKRPDSFVTAAVTYPKRFNPLGLNLDAIAAFLPEQDAKHYDLQLNCQLDQVQLKITFSPKFVSLKRFVLVVSCAPSLECCYVTEILTQHSLIDWDTFDSDGEELVRRWYKMSWTDTCETLVKKICAKLQDAVNERVHATLRVLG